MEVRIGFDEIHDYVKTHYGQDIKLSYVSDKEVSLSVIKRILIKDVAISVDLLVEDVKNDEITLSYKGGFGVDLLISGALKFLLGKFPEFGSAIGMGEKNNVTVKLSQIQKLKATLEYLELKGISFAQGCLILELALK